MASVRSSVRGDGSTAHRVFFRHEGQQTCYTFEDMNVAETFRTAVNQLGSAAAIALHRLEREGRSGPSVTVTEWVGDYIDHLTVQPDTLTKYRAYLANDIGPVLGQIPIGELTDRDIARWINGMTGSPATISKKARFLSQTLTKAVASKKITENVAAGAKIPTGQKREMVFLTHEEFAILLGEVTESWRPLVRFLVASGCRWGEATALYPSDVDRAAGTVRISRAWKYDPSTGHVLGSTKTVRSVRTIDVPKNVLDRLDYSHAWLFVGRDGSNWRKPGDQPVRNHGFARRVWAPAVERAQPKIHKKPRIHDLRHTCASWMIANREPLPVIQQHLGHESIKTTVDRYGHLDRRSARVAADAIGKLLE